MTSYRSVFNTACRIFQVGFSGLLVNLPKSSRIFIAALLSFLTAEVSHAQQGWQVVSVHPMVGEEIDRQERDKYGLFRTFINFHSAVFWLMPDSTYRIEITYSDAGVPKTQTWTISQKEFLRNYRNTIAQFDVRFGGTREHWKSPLISITTSAGHKVTGSFQGITRDSLELVSNGFSGLSSQEVPETTRVNLNDVFHLSLVRKSPFWKYVVRGMLPGVVGMAIGFASGDDPPGFLSSTAGEKALLLGGAFGFVGVSVGGSIGALKGVDVDVPWHGKSEEDKNLLLNNIGAGRYRSPMVLGGSVWVGRISPVDQASSLGLGGRLRLYFTPRSGLELSYGGTGWRDISHANANKSYPVSELSKVRYITASAFITLTRGWTVNPFVGWGLASVWKTYTAHYDEFNGFAYDDHNLSLAVSGGAQIRLSRLLNLEGRGELILGTHFGMHVGLIFGGVY